MPPTRPTYDVIADLIRNGGWQYEPAALLEEIDLQERKRGHRITDQQRHELLELAAELHTQATA